MSDLLLLIGIPGSGKSCLAAQLQKQFQEQFWQQACPEQNSADQNCADQNCPDQNCPDQDCRVVSTDQIRASLFGDEAVQGDWRLVWQVVNQEFRQAADLTGAGLTIYDATNARRRSRREVIRLARQVGFQQVFGLWLNPPLVVCLERNRQRSRQVPETVIQRMYQQIRTSPPKLSEGLDLLLHCDHPNLWGDPSLGAANPSNCLTHIATRLNQRFDRKLNSRSETRSETRFEAGFETASSRPKLDQSDTSTGIAPAIGPEPNPQSC